MFAPHLGRVSAYEEIWHEYDSPPAGEPSWILQSVDGGSFLGRIGGYYLALRQEGGFGGEYVALREDREEDGRAWVRKYAVGGGKVALPSYGSAKGGEFAGEGSWKKGEVVRFESMGMEFVVRAHSVA